MIIHLRFLRLIILANRKILAHHIKHTCAFLNSFLNKSNQVYVSYLIEANLRKSNFRGWIYCAPLFQTQRDLAEEPSKGGYGRIYRLIY